MSSGRHTTREQLASSMGREPDEALSMPATDLAEENDRLRALLEFGRELRSELELRPLLRLVCRSALRATGAGGAVVALRKKGSSEPDQVDAIGVDFAYFGEIGRSLLRETLAIREVRVIPLPDKQRFVIAAPLIAHDEHLGALVLLSHPGARPSAEEREYALILAQEAAAAIHNARSYALAKHEVRSLAALSQVVESISSELDITSLLVRIVSNAAEMFHAQDGIIALAEPDQTLRIRAVYTSPQEMIGEIVEPGQGLVGHVLAERKSVMVDRYQDDVRLPHPLQFNTGPAVAVPIWWQGEIKGVFGVFSSWRDRAFSDDDRELMELLAKHVAIAIENSRLYGGIRSQLDEIVGFHQLGTLLLEEHDFERVLRSVCEHLQRLTNSNGVGIALLGDHPDFLEIRTIVGPSAEVLQGARIPIQGSFAGEALRTNLPQRSDDAQHDERGNRQSLVLGNTHSILSVPMKTRQRTVGVLSIYNKVGARGFTERDAEVATLFANQAAVAIENARLYEQTREYAVIEERNRLARELHDSVTQSLFSVSLLSQAALNLWERDAKKARERLERAHEVAQGALEEMRALLFQLRPSALQEEGLLSAVRKHLAAVRSRDGLNVLLEILGDERRLPAPVEDAAFRIVQETLNNVVKHARATRASVTIAFAPAELQVCTADDGVGFDPHVREQAGTLGLRGMHERAESVGGRLTIASEPQKGTRVCALLPIEADGH